jgi:hypothetical protein
MATVKSKFIIQYLFKRFDFHLIEYCPINFEDISGLIVIVIINLSKNSTIDFYIFVSMTIKSWEQGK